MSLKPSLYFACYLSVLHVMVGLVVWFTQLPLPTQWALIAVVVFSLFFYLLRDVFLLLPSSVREVRVTATEVLLRTRDGRLLEGLVAHKTFISSFFVVLRVKLPNKRLPVVNVIFPDALGRKEFKRLCMMLRLGY